MADVPFGANCQHQLTAKWQPEKRPVNGLNIEQGYFLMDRCIKQPPVNVAGVAADAFRWLGSGGSELAFGVCCCSLCPMRNESATTIQRKPKLPKKSTDNLGVETVAITIQIPPALGKAVNAAKDKSGRRTQAEILHILGESLGVDVGYRPPGRFPPPATAVATEPEPAKKRAKKKS